MSVYILELLNVAGYKFVPLENLDSLIPEFQNKCDQLGLKGSVYLSPYGINFSIAGTEENIDTYIQFMEEDSRVRDIPLKKTFSETQPFRRMKVRLKKEIISLGRDDINPRELTGDYISPRELFEMYETKEDVIVLDTRNEYETRVGLFENALDLHLDTFRDFPSAIETLPEEYKDKKAGFSNVKQLEGGVLDYFKETGGAYWNGDCFVFDERVALDKELKETEYIYWSSNAQSTGICAPCYGCFR